MKMVKLFFILLNLPFILNASEVKSKHELWTKMEAEVNSWTDKLGKKIDDEIKESIIVLNLLGFTTCSSCQGHIDWGNPYPWISFSVEDKELDFINVKHNEILRLIDEKERLVKEKFPDVPFSKIDFRVEFPELIKLLKQSNEYSQKKEEFVCLKLVKLKELISKFYNNKIIDYDRVLILEEISPNDYFLKTIGSKWQVARTESDRLIKLKEYQEEFKLFTKFLKDYFFSN